VHYIFPFRTVRNKFDPTRPASRSWLRKSWDALRQVTGLARIRPHDLRHHAITRLYEEGAEDQTVVALAGHHSSRMSHYYSQVRRRRKLDAVRPIDTLRLLEHPPRPTGPSGAPVPSKPPQRATVSDSERYHRLPRAS